jgi:nicotinate dehydrogenase subunit A
MSVKLTVNGNEVELDIDSDVPLLYALRNDLELNGPKYGCGVSQCGSCAVLVDGSPARACVVPVSSVIGKSVVTLEGLGSRDAPHPIQAAFIEEQAMQCGYCANGMMIAAAALLENNSDPTEEEIRSALRANLCRCGAHGRIIRAVKRAAQSVREGAA